MLDLTKLYDRVLALPTLESRMEQLRKEIQKAEDEVSGLLWQYERESRDIKQIQKESLSSFLFKLIGKYEDKLEKEQQEEIDAKLAYDRAAARAKATAKDAFESLKSAQGWATYDAFTRGGIISHIAKYL